MSRFRQSLFLASLLVTWACSDTTAPPSPLASSISIYPRVASLILNGSVRLAANVYDQHKQLVSNAPIAWLSSDPGAITVSDSGWIRAVASGTATISATAEGATDTLTLSVASAAFSQLSTSGSVTCGVTTAGVAYCRGDNTFGQLGSYWSAPDPNTFVPVDVFSSVLASLPFRLVAPGEATTCGLGTDSTAWCWGYGQHGELGIGVAGALGPSTLQTPYAQYPVTGGHRFVQLVLGSDHTCGLTPASVAYCWGENVHGPTGDQLNITWDPAAIVGYQFNSIAAGGESSCGVAPAGAAYCWGSNFDGQLGVVTDTVFSAPTLLPAGSFSSLTVRGITCGRDPDGTAYCWGYNTPYPRPDPVSGGLSFTQVSSAFEGGCGLTADSSAFCWGYYDLTPQVVPSPVKFSSVAAGDDWNCAVGADSAAYCWRALCPSGYNPYCGGEQTVFQVPGDLKFQSVANAFYGVGCGLSVTDSLYCWGENLSDNQVPPPPPATAPQLIPGSGGLLALTQSSPLCGLAADSTAVCWAVYYDAGSITSTGPQVIAGGVHYSSFDRFGNRWCGTVSGQVYCADSTNTTPGAVPGATGFATVETYSTTTCGLKAGGNAYCWGKNTFGELGLGYASGWSTHPLGVGGGHQFLSVAIGADHACGVATDSSTWCWGGIDIPDTLRFPPRLVPGGLKLGHLAAGFDFTCGLTGSGSAYCWGRGLTAPTPYQASQHFQSLSASNYYPYHGYLDVCGLTLAGDPMCWNLPSTVPAPRRATARLRTSSGISSPSRP
ncbi:MAG TPA: hypothetical protein VEV39_05765 [Gemmatimonadales bacterium]|nr:hypothetical protein [Gemmatimonadales bacterium]